MVSIQIRRPAIIAVALIAVILSGVAGVNAEEAFDPQFHGNGVDGIVHCALVDGADLYVGGDFGAAGDVAAYNIAYWDGAQWHALGPGLAGEVFDLAIFEGDLVACGSFFRAGSLTVNQVARWDGSQWHALGNGVGTDPYEAQYALAVFDGILVCGGHVWNGSSWYESFPVSGFIRDLELFDDLLVIGGDFSSVGGWEHHNVVATNLATLVAMPGQDFEIYDLQAHDGQLHALRWWVDTLDPAPVSVWTGTDWADVGDIAELNEVEYLQLLSRDGQLHLMGVDKIPGDWTTKIATWNGVSWNWVLGATAYSGVLARTVVNHPDGILLGGRFGVCESTPATGLVLLRDEGIFTFGPSGLGVSGRDPGPVWGATATPDGVVLCGTFEAVGSLVSRSAALFDGQAWHSRALGETQCHLVVWFDGQLHAFPRTGEESYPQQWIWNGTGWDVHDVGTTIWATTAAVAHEGRLLTTGTDVYDWTVPGDPQLFADLDALGWAMIHWQGKLVVGGIFTVVDGVSVSKIAILDGETWISPGDGVTGDVYSLVEYEGRLIAGGRLTAAGSQPVVGVAAWNGLQWEAMGDGLDTWVNALAVYRGELYAGGRFTATGDTLLSRFARWTGDQWEDVGGGCDRTVDGLTVFDDRLYLTGSFRVVGDGVPASRLAVWDGEVLTAVPAVPSATVRLAPAVPNPFNPATSIRFTLSRDAWTTLQVHDLRGRFVVTLVDGPRSGGEHAVTWAGRDGAGRAVPAGSYLLRLEAGGEVRTGKVMLVE